MKKTRNKWTASTVTNKNSIVKIPRTTFNVPSILQTSFNGGKLIPLKLYECYPGDTLSLNLASLVRVASPFIKAPMGEIEYACYAFKIPYRILETDFENIIANYQADPDWNSDVTDQLAQIVIPESGFAEKSIADYLGIIPGVGPAVGATGAVNTLNHLPFRAYCKVWNDWFRDENLMNTIYIDTSNTTTQGVSTLTDYQTDAIAGGSLCPTCKTKSADYFCTTLPSSQKGMSVTFGIGENAPIIASEGATLPVFGSGKTLAISNGSLVGGVLPYRHSDIDHIAGAISGFGTNIGTTLSGSQTGLTTNVTAGVPTKQWFDDTANNYENSGLTAPFDGIQGQLYADLSRATAVSVNDLRLAFQLQKIKEADARYGNRYTEYLLGRWGVRSSDGRLQRPEYLGSQKMILNIQQTVNTAGSTSPSNEDNPQSNISAYSISQKKNFMFETSCTEHCYIMILGTCRIKHRTYSQGIPRTFLKKNRFDFYVPELANIGEQPIYNAEIYYSGTNSDTDAFGFQEAFFDLRCGVNQVTGSMRPTASQSLAVWNLSDYYTSLPTLSAEWIKEDMSALDRTLVYPSTTSDQFIADLYFDAKFTRPMPLHSIPGLIDHSWGSRF